VTRLAGNENEGYCCTGLIIFLYCLLHHFHSYAMFAVCINQKEKNLHNYEAFLGNLHNYEAFLENVSNGDIVLNIDLSSTVMS
jgi:hypothetical protein